MNRRELMVLPGAAALVASQGLMQAAPVSKRAPGAPAQLSHKAVMKYSSSKWIAKIPKSEKKSAKYINSLVLLLSLSSNQQAAATAIFTSALASLDAVRADSKTAKTNLNEAVRRNDSAGISTAATALGTLRAQRKLTAANASAAFFQVLTADQQQKLTSFQG